MGEFQNIKLLFVVRSRIIVFGVNSCYFSKLFRLTEQNEILNEIYFYGGITYYHKTWGFDDGQEKIIKVGCDFNHILDQGVCYNLEDIQVHVKKTIDSLYKVIPEYGKERDPK